MKIPYVNLSAQWTVEKRKILSIISNVFKKGEFVNGKEVDNFEKNISRFCDTKYAVSFNSGTDALTIALILLGVKRGDEVITPPNSFISSTASIVHIGAIPVFADVLRDQNIDPKKIKKLITKKTKAIMPVHLTGRVCEMKEILQISKNYGVPIVEDAAQSIGSKYFDKKAGSFGSIGCFSAHPLKNLNAAGDGGFFVTNNSTFYTKAQEMKNHGLINRNKVKKFGYISRMDVLQAAILNYRLSNLNTVILKRRKNAEFYLKNLDRKKYFVVDEKDYQFNTYHTFVIQTKKRDRLIKYLKKKGIGSAIHYPIPIHLQPAAKYLNYKKGDFPETESQARKIITIPIHENLRQKDLDYILNNLNNFK
jgi:dTDP-4-amino-4,6-dideoxygalactose transaminase